jgi:hypothetical protein
MVAKAQKKSKKQVGVKLTNPTTVLLGEGVTSSTGSTPTQEEMLERFKASARPTTMEEFNKINDGISLVSKDEEVGCRQKYMEKLKKSYADNNLSFPQPAPMDIDDTWIENLFLRSVRDLSIFKLPLRDILHLMRHTHPTLDKQLSKWEKQGTVKIVLALYDEVTLQQGLVSRSGKHIWNKISNKAKAVKKGLLS